MSQNRNRNRFQNQNSQNRYQNHFQNQSRGNAEQLLLARWNVLLEEQARLSFEEQSVLERYENVNLFESQQIGMINSEEQRRAAELANTQQQGNLLRTGATMAAVLLAGGRCTASMNYAATQRMNFMEKNQLHNEMENARLRIALNAQAERKQLLSALAEIQNRGRQIEFEIQSVRTELSVFHLSPAAFPRMCPTCGRPGMAGAKYCSNCGAALPATVPTALTPVPVTAPTVPDPTVTTAPTQAALTVSPLPTKKATKVK